MHGRRPLAPLLVALLLAAAPAPAEDEPDPEVFYVELIPDDPASFGAHHIFAPITGLFLGGPGYWYGPRRLRIETTPPGADLDLFYVRANFQKGYEQAEAPAVVILPERIRTTPRDSVTVRAQLDGYQQAEVNVKLRSRTEDLLIELAPLANSLVGVGHLYFGGRASLEFLTREAPTFRVQKRDPGRLSLVLVGTGNTEKASRDMEGLSDALVASLEPRQLGEDLVVQVDLTAAGADEVDVRSRQDYDAIRRLHRFSLDIVPRDGPSPVARARQALARIGPGDVAGCALVFDDALRERLDAAQLARALTPGANFQDPYLRAALDRLGEVSGGAVVLEDGTRYRTSIPIELSAASSQAGEVKGYLALLREFVAELEAPAHRRGTLRGLVAPEVPPAVFDALLDEAEAAERRCRAR